MKTTTAARHYFGATILPTSSREYADAGYRWYVQRKHTSGLPYGEQDSARYTSLAAAKQAVRAAATR